MARIRRFANGIRAAGLVSAATAAVAAAALAGPAAAQDRLTGSAIAGVTFPEASRAWTGDAEGAKAATLDLAAALAARSCGPSEYHLWQSVNESPDDIRNKTDAAFLAAGWQLTTLSRDEDGSRIHLASRGADQLILSWQAGPGAVALLMCQVAGERQVAMDDQTNAIAAAEATEPVADEPPLPRPNPREEAEAAPAGEAVPGAPLVLLPANAMQQAVTAATAPKPEDEEADPAALPAATPETAAPETAALETAAPETATADAADAIPDLPGPDDADEPPPYEPALIDSGLGGSDPETAAGPETAASPATATAEAAGDAATPSEAGPQDPFAGPGVSVQPIDIAALLAAESAEPLTAATAVATADGAAAADAGAGSGSGALVLRILLMLLAAGLAGATVWLLRWRRPQVAEAPPAPWPRALATILDSHVETERETAEDGVEVIRFAPSITYEFEAGGALYQSTRFRDGEVALADRMAAEEIVARYPAYAAVEIQFDPLDPANAVIERDDPPRPLPLPVAGVACGAVAAIMLVGALII